LLRSFGYRSEARSTQATKIFHRLDRR